MKDPMPWIVAVVALTVISVAFGQVVSCNRFKACIEKHPPAECQEAGR